MHPRVYSGASLTRDKRVGEQDAQQECAAVNLEYVKGCYRIIMG